MPPSRREVLELAQALAAGGVLAGCSTTQPADPATTATRATNSPSPGPSPTASVGTPEDVSSPVRRLAFGNAVFGVDLLQSASEDTGNQLFSPYSIAIALGMTYAGARGETRTQMESTLHYPFGGTELHRTIETIRERLDTGDAGESTPSPSPTPGDDQHDVPLQLFDANALWGQEEFPWREAYLSLVELYYSGGLHQLNFAEDPDAARRKVNQWVSTMTRENITDLLPPGSISSATRLVVTNAVYFQAIWDHPFMPSNTESRPFTAIDGSQTDIPMMTNDSREFPYAEVGGHQLIELPYRDDDYGLVIVLPPAGEYESFESSFTASKLWNWLDELEARAGAITMPKFQFDSQFQLSEALAELGMPAAFDPSSADLSGMAEEGEGDALYIDEVHHETFISVDEKGTEAAAATGIVIPVSKAVGEEPFEMTVDRPFLFLIRERRTGAVLFLGRMVDAEGAQPPA